MGDLDNASTPHPWNRSFRWSSPPAAPRTLTPAQAEQFDRDGYVVVDDVLDAATLAKVVREVDHHASRAEEAVARAGGRVSIAEAGAITFAPHLVRHSAILRRLTRQDTILGLCLDLVGPDVQLYWDQAVYKHTEQPRRFPWHQDNGYGFVEPQQYLTVWLALTDADVNNGCPWVAPGVHRQGTLRHTFRAPLGLECFEQPAHAVPAEVTAGGAVVFSSLTPHLTGPNISGQVRKAYILQYAPAGARVLEGDPDVGPPTGSTPADHPEWQYPVLRGGRPV